MTIRKQASGRFYAVLKSGRSYVTGRTSSTQKRAARLGWHGSGRRWREARSARGSSHSTNPAVGFGSPNGSIRYLPRPSADLRSPLGPDRVRSPIDQRGDRSGDHPGVDHPHEKWLGRVVSASFSRLAVGVFLGGARADDRRQSDYADSSTACPGASCRNVPFSEDELERIYLRATARDQRLADLLLIDAWTGLRWSELRATRVRGLRRGSNADRGGKPRRARRR